MIVHLVFLLSSLDFMFFAPSALFFSLCFRCSTRLSTTNVSDLYVVAPSINPSEAERAFLSSIATDLAPSSSAKGSHMCVNAAANGIKARCLVDNGSQVTLVSRSFVGSMGPAIISDIHKPINLYNAGGELHSTLSQIASLRLVLHGHVETLRAYVTDLPYYNIILGDPWLKFHNPHINWEKRTIKFKRCIRRGCIDHVVVVPAFDPSQTQQDTSPSSSEEDEDPPPEVKQISALTFMKEIADPANAFCMLAPTGLFPSQSDLDRASREELNLQISMMSSLPSKFSPDDFEKHMKGPKSYTEHELLSTDLVPREYAEYTDLFNRSIADTLPPHRDGVDHEIHLVPGSDNHLPHVKNYWSLSPKEQEAVAKYITENRKKGFIRASSSPIAAPVLVVRKPGGGLRVCVDYRSLNNITVKMRYPIPLISETLNNLARAVIFSKFDIIHAFNRIRIKEGHEYLTAFNTRFGQFEYLVLPFGLCNGPATFQQFINSTLQDYLDQFVTAYLDDILVYSDSIDTHVTHVTKVFDRLRSANLQLDIDKSVFHVQEVKHLGLIITTSGVKMDPAKLDAIRDWQPPRTVSDLLAWLGFCGYYRQFIPNFAKLTNCFYSLTKGKVALSRTGKRVMRYDPFSWTPELDEAFQRLKDAFATAPELFHYDPLKRTVIETDASDFMTAGVLSQFHGDELKPVAFFSKKMNSAQWNYAIYDKELLAIVRCLEQWRPELMGLAESFDIYTDHQSLEHFMSTKKLTARQARWAEFLSGFDFIIKYTPGKMNRRADCLTRRPQDTSHPPDSDSPRLSVVLPREKLDPQIQHRLSFSAITADFAAPPPTSDISVAFHALSFKVNFTTRSQAAARVSLSPSPPSVSPGNRADTPAQTGQEHSAPPSNDDNTTISDDIPTASFLPNLECFQAAYTEDPTLSEAVTCVNRGDRALPSHIFKQLKVSITDLQSIDGLLYHHGRLLVPAANGIRLNILDYYHQSSFFGHPGEKQLFDLVTRCFYWSTLRRDISTYVHACYSCRRAKPTNQKPQGLLQPLPPPDRAWHDLTLDLLEDLPQAIRRGRCFKHALIVVDRLTKDRILEPLTTKSAEEIGEALHRRVFCTFGFPSSIISDRGTAFTSGLIQDYCKRHNIKWKCSTAHHPQTDGQSERLIRSVKEFLIHYINFAQNDWPDFLPDAEFSARVSVSDTTGMSPFFALYGFHPSTPGESLLPHFSDARLNSSCHISSAERAARVLDFLQSHIRWSQDRYAEAANAHRRPHPKYRVGDRVFIDTRHFSNDRTSRSLGFKRIGPCPITRVIDNKAYEVSIPPSLASAGVTNVFHPDKLSLAPTRSFPGQQQSQPPPVMISDGSTSHPEWEIDEIVACRRTAAYGTQYRATFVGDWPEWNARPPWQPWSDFINAPQKVLDFHARHPRAPPPPSHFS